MADSGRSSTAEVRVEVGNFCGPGDGDDGDPEVLPASRRARRGRAILPNSMAIPKATTRWLEYKSTEDAVRDALT